MGHAQQGWQVNGGLARAAHDDSPANPLAMRLCATTALPHHGPGGGGPGKKAESKGLARISPVFC